MNNALLHMTDLFPITTYPNPFAYRDRFQHLHELDKEMVFSDSKGEWMISGLSPKDLGWCGEKQIPRYELCIKLKNDKNPKLRWSHFVYVIVWGNDSMEDLKKRIKSYIGYTPQPKTLKTIYELTQEMISAWKEQDLWYSMQDASIAKAKIKELKELLIQRYQNGEEQREEERYGYRRTPIWMMYLTQEEEKILKEYQRIVNGRHYLDETDTYGACQGIMGLSDFAKDVLTIIYQIDEERKRQNDKEHKQKLSQLLETNPTVRKITAHYLKAKEEARIYGVKDIHIQLVHRLYGYTLNEKAYFERYNQFTEEYLKPCGITIWDLYYLSRKAIQSDEILPLAPTDYQREKPFYYGDQVVTNGKPKKVKKVGIKYVYVEYQKDGILIKHAKSYQPFKQVI